MRTKVGVAIVAAALCIVAPFVWLARDLPVARAADDGAEIARLRRRTK